jgi:hydroxyacylglutathione hydrolase
MNMSRLESTTFPSKTQKAPGGMLHFWRSGGTNLGYLLQIEGSNRVLGVDVPNGEELLGYMDREGFTLSALLLTHTHHDHVNGLEEVVRQTGCRLHAAEPVSSLPRVHVTDRMEWQLEGLTVLALDTSGHSPLDVSYVFPELNLCFCGDTLFEWGCGRMFAGPAETLWASLDRLRSLPDETRFCPGHDFREDNEAFLRGECSRWSACDPILNLILESRENHPLPPPFELREQKATNPFLRADDPEIARLMGRAGSSPAEVFAELRSRRNAY